MSSSPLVVGGTIFVDSAAGSFYALGQTGRSTSAAARSPSPVAGVVRCQRCPAGSWQMKQSAPGSARRR